MGAAEAANPGPETRATCSAAAVDEAEEGAVETGRLTAAAVLGARGYALRTEHGNPESTDYLINSFAQLDADKYVTRRNESVSSANQILNHRH
ncbi:hypothetical protein [Thauera sp. GDN1]|uniref:hypothetical protein n=1 Tax=Thauera sp. GDN1 TaxID=2944810 RepID=UPI00247931FF|nr:hypothetical protein [Thauera sp. GDN1]